VSKNYEDPIAALVEYTTSMTTNAISIPWDATVFGKESELSLYIYKNDLMDIYIKDGGLKCVYCAIMDDISESFINHFLIISFLDINCVFSLSN